MKRIFFICYCSTGDVFIPIMYILDFIENIIRNIINQYSIYSNVQIKDIIKI
jgi:hypothetical protein